MSLPDHSRTHLIDPAHPAVPAGTWELVASESTVELTGRHFLVLPFRGSLPVRSGRAEVAGDGTLVRLDAEVAVAGFETGNPSRDAAVRGGSFLDAERYPELRFTGEPSSSVGAPSIAGLLGVKGREIPTNFVVEELVVTGGRVTVRAAADVDRHRLRSRRAARLGRAASYRAGTRRLRPAVLSPVHGPRSSAATSAHAEGPAGSDPAGPSAWAPRGLGGRVTPRVPGSSRGPRPPR